MAAGAHDRLDNTGESYFGDGCVEFYAVRGKTVGRGLDSEFFGGKTADSFAVHCQPGGAGCRSDMVALFLEFDEHRSGDCLDLGDNMIGFLKLDYAAQFVGVEHVEHVGAVGDLHCRSACVGVAGNDFDAEALKLDSYLFSQLAAAE